MTGGSFEFSSKAVSNLSWYIDTLFVDRMCFTFGERAFSPDIVFLRFVAPDLSLFLLLLPIVDELLVKFVMSEWLLPCTYIV